LVPPQPMVRTLKALDKMDQGDTLSIINDRRPMFLYEELDERGYVHETEAQEDGSSKITITKSGDKHQPWNSDKIGDKYQITSHSYHLCTCNVRELYICSVAER